METETLSTGGRGERKRKRKARAEGIIMGHAS